MYDYNEEEKLCPPPSRDTDQKVTTGNELVEPMTMIARQTIVLSK